MEGENCQQELLFRKDGPLDGASNANLDCCDNYDDLYDELSADDKELVRQKSMNLCKAGPRNPDFRIYSGVVTFIKSFYSVFSLVDMVSLMDFSDSPYFGPHMVPAKI